MREPYIKTRIGEHDFHKPACFEYCRMAKEACPFVRDGIEGFKDIKRWSDVADERRFRLMDVLSGNYSPSSTPF